MARLLDLLPSQTTRPRLIVVDSSADNRTSELVASFAASGDWPFTTYVRSEPGLTVQRMRGVSELSPGCEIVHFIDDDVALEPEYFAQIERAFTDAAVVGVGGLITNQPPSKRHILNRLFLLDSTREGVVLPSGVNAKVYSAEGDVDVEWLSGCSMSFRRSLFATLSFDTSMVGYSLGEDVDFSFGVGKQGRLVVAGSARLEHLEVGSLSLDRAVLSRDELVRRYIFVRRYRGRGVSLVAFWWSFAGDFVVTAGKSLFYGDRREWRAKLSGLRAGFRTIRAFAREGHAA